MTKPLTELFEDVVEDTWSHSNPEARCGADSEAERRKPIDLATKKLIEALEKIKLYSEGEEGSAARKWLVRNMKEEARFALAEFRASLEDVE